MRYHLVKTLSIIQSFFELETCVINKGVGLNIFFTTYVFGSSKAGKYSNMGIKTESLAYNLSEGLTPDIYIKHTVTKQNDVFFIDDECPALTVKYQYYINNTVDMFNRFLLTQHKIGYRSNNKIESYLVPAWD